MPARPPITTKSTWWRTRTSRIGSGSNEASPVGDTVDLHHPARMDDPALHALPGRDTQPCLVEGRVEAPVQHVRVVGELLVHEPEEIGERVDRRSHEAALDAR